MKKIKFFFTARRAMLAAAVLVIGAFSIYGGADLSKSLKTAVIYYSSNSSTTSPISYTAKNFYCYPGPIQLNDGTKYAGTYNTYYYGYGEAYANSGVKGTWCTHYLPSIQQDPTLYDDPPLKTSTTNTPTDHTSSYISTAVYKVTDANGLEDQTNPMYRRWLAHKNAAQIHENKVVFYKETLAGYGTFYKTGNSPGGSTSPDAAGSGLYGYAIVHCPDGALVVDHTNTASQYKASQSSRHYGSSPTDENGLYDGSGHYWCELNGVAVNPIVGPESGKSVPDYAMTDRDKLFKFEFPDGTKKYTSYNDSTNVSSSGFVKCSDGASAVGPFTGGNQYTNQYLVKEAGKRDYYRCYDSTKGIFTNAITDSTALASPYSSIFSSYFKTDNVKNCDSTYSTCQPSCAAGDATCGGANTVGATTQPCASNTYWCQTTSVDYRYCSADATCTTAEMTPPAPTWTVGAPTNLRVTGSKITGFASTESVPVAADFAAAGTGIPYGQATLTVQISQDTSFATAWVRPSSTGTVTAVGSTVNSYIDNFPATGTFYWRAKMSLGTQESAWTSAPYGSFVVCSTGKTWNGTSCITPVVATCALDIKLNDNKTTYNKGDSVNYTYSCSPAGTKAASTTVQVVKPDGTATTYNSGTNIDTATLGFSTSNLDAGSYTIRVCLNSTCTSGIASVNFTLAAAETVVTETSPITL
ncbi:hypothetical protein HYW82_04655, partial [Candidatus Peregrinibacteria bacterium]|nr:hypothetical protein [Candidatus Peregrinibacteria bacterium]